MPSSSEQNPNWQADSFSRPWWMLSKHAETILCLFDERRSKPVPYENHVVSTFDNDQVLMQWKVGAPDKPLIVIFHGLEGCSRTRSVALVAKHFADLQWTVAVPHFRTCGMMNLYPRAYNAADGKDPLWMLKYLCGKFNQTDCYAVGISLGGNALVHALDSGNAPVRAAATICAPLDLTAVAAHINRGMTHFIYGRYFVKKLRKKIKEKLHKFPNLILGKQLHHIHTLADFDNTYTAPMHGYDSATEYWQQGTVLDALTRMSTPLLCINARNDPIVPIKSLPQSASNTVQFVRPKHGGHGGFFGKPHNWLGATVGQFFMHTHNQTQPTQTMPQEQVAQI